MEFGRRTESPPRLSSSRPKRMSASTATAAQAEFGRSGGGYKRKGGRGSGWQTPQSPSASANANTRAKRPRVRLSSGRKPSAAAGAPPPEVINLEEEYQVETILDKKIGQSGQSLYYIKWMGWPESANTWEPVGSLDGCEEVLKEFEVRWLQQQKEKNDEARAGPSGLSMSKVNGEPKLTEGNGPASSSSYTSASASGVKARTTAPVATATSTSQLTDQVDDEDENEDSEELMDYDYDILSKCPADKIPKELIAVVDIGGLLTYLIEWEQLDDDQSAGVGVEGGPTEEEPDRGLIKALPFKLMYPAMVIKYYEGHINFTNGTLS